nr:protein kinase [Luteitalea pratensis]
MLGTAAYMSPEQAKGRPTDKRSDIWAFGCVLFEMLTGERAFPADDVAEALAAVLKTEPDWSALPADMPPLARRLVQRCLEKNVSARVPDIAVALFELSELATAWPTTQATAAPRRGRTRWLVAAASLAAALASGVGVWLWLRPDGSATLHAPVTRLALVPPSGVQFADVPYPLAITPDGRRIVFVGEKNGVRQFYVRSLDSLDAQLIPGTEGIDPRVTLSPDGRSLLAFDLRNRTLKKVPIDGGTAESICQLPGATLGVVRGASWGRGGNIVFAMEPEPGLMIVRDTGGVAQRLTKAAEGDVHGRPQFLPDGKRVLFTGIRAQGGLFVASTDTREVRSVMPAPFAQYVANGHLLFLRDGTLWVVKFDVNALQPIGDASPLAEAVSFVFPGGPARMSVSDDGRLVYMVGAAVTGRATRESSLMLVDTAAGRESPLPNIPPGPYAFVRISPTGDKIAVGTNPGAAARVKVYDTRRSVMTPITADTRSGRPLWADRETLVFEQIRGGAAAVYSQRADGTGQATLVWTPSAGGWTYAPNARLPDGRLIVSRARLGSYGIYREQDLLLATPGNPAATPLLASTANEANGAVSPNGEWIAYESDRTGRYEVWLERFPQMTERQPVSTTGGASPVWSIDGKRLFYMSNDGRQVFEVQVSSRQGPALTVSKPRLRVQGDYMAPLWGYRRFDVMPDGNQFVLLKPAAEDRGTPLEAVVVEGWFDELRRRLP